MPRRNPTGVVCKFLIGCIDDGCMVLFSGEPLIVTCAGLSSSLVFIVVFLVVSDRSERKVGRRLCNQSDQPAPSLDNINHAAICERCGAGQSAGGYSGAPQASFVGTGHDVLFF